MTFIGYADGVKGYLFMRKPNNVVFTVTKALFDETMFPNCPDTKHQGFTPVGDTPDADDHIPSENEFDNFDNDDNFLPQNNCQPSYPPPAPKNHESENESSDSEGGWLKEF